MRIFLKFLLTVLFFQHEGIWVNSQLGVHEGAQCLNRKAGLFELCVVMRLAGCCMYPVSLMTLHFPSQFDLLYAEL